MSRDTLNFKILSTANDGRVSVLINGIKYIYYLDAALIPYIINLAKFRPGQALKKLKKSSFAFYKG